MLDNYSLSRKEECLVYVIAIASLLSVFGNVSWGLNAYYASVICFSLFALHDKTTNTSVFFLFWIWIVICSVFNSVYDWRILSFGLLLICATPALSSAKLYYLRKAIMYMMCILLPIVALLNLYAYIMGINYYLIINVGFNQLQFSGFMTEPLWFGCISGGSNVSLTYFILSHDSSKKFFKYLLIFLLVISVFLTVVSGSRSALLSSVIGMGMVAYFYSKDKKQFISYFFVAVFLVIISFPFFKSGSAVLTNKLESQTLDNNSRTLLWTQRLNEFYSSPIWGIGFATMHRWGRVITGTIETGSGWLTVLSQTGIVGAAFFVAFFKRIKKNLHIIRSSNDLILFWGVFVYLTVLSFFEGFIYTIGYVPCFMFWLVLGIFYECDKYEIIEYDEE